MNTIPTQNPTFKWFPGLNALRFAAATLVVIMHIHSNQQRMGLPTLPDLPILSKGLHAVSFFFVLSGFLITYLLLKEKTKTNSIDVKAFYWRRVFRIWPLYFLVVALGLLFYWVVVPALDLDFEVSYSKSLAAALYLFFGANLISSLYHVGGILHITWSIAVEEQFYLFWAPIFRRFSHRIELLIWIIISISYAVHFLNLFDAFGLSTGLQSFVHTLQFHYMGIGAWFAYKLYKNQDRLLSSVFFRSKRVQFVLYAFIILFLMVYQKSFWIEVFLPLPLGFLSAWLIVNSACNPNVLINPETSVTHYLGSISYGIYMLHMPVVYACSFLCRSLEPIEMGGSIYFAAFYLGCLGTTILLASLSYKLLETPLLKKGQRFLKSKRTKKLNSLQQNLLLNR